MIIKVERRRIRIEPDNETDEAYIEEVLGLKGDGECAVCRRESAIGVYDRVWRHGDMVLVIEKYEVKE